MTVPTMAPSEQPRTRPVPPLRVAVLGCGAITRGFHLPVLAGHDAVRLQALVDPRIEAARDLATGYGVPRALADGSALDPAEVDAVILATPAHLHAEGAVAWMQKGVHVLVEKPMALTLDDATRMVETARATGRVLSVGVYRRLLPAIRLLRAALDARAVGPLESIDLAVGSAYTWPLTTLSGMRKSESGGGMLLDMGTHVIDLLFQLVPGTATLTRYADNSLGGVESDCVIELTLAADGGAVPARIELSRTRTLHNTFRFHCARGTLRWSFGERDKVTVDPHVALTDPLSGTVREAAVDARWRDEPEVMGYESFRAQVDDLVAAIRGERPSALSGESMLPTVALIEECYQRAERLDEPWVSVGLPSFAPAVHTRPRPRGRVLVTGATGFIGTRLMERLYLGSDWNPRALVRSPASAARLARLPVEMTLGDLTDPTSLAPALDGCEALVHCGLGTSWRRQERVAVTVEGTRHLVEAALAARVKRFVHISSISVYGEPTGTIDESAPVRPKKGWDYAESKVAAERIVLDAAARGLPAVILRVAVVYGPFGPTMVVRPLEYLRRGALVLVDCAGVASNTVYVDNVAEAIQRALEAPADRVAGQAFNVSDDDGFTWGEYFGFFAEALGAQLRHVTREELAKLSPQAAAAPNGLVRLVRATQELAFSAETKRFAGRVLASPWGSPVRWFFETYPTARARLKAVVRPETPLIYRPVSAQAPQDLFKVDPIHATISAAKFNAEVGNATAVPRRDAMNATLCWLRQTPLGRTDPSQGD